jgi:hypothetical protein
VPLLSLSLPLPLPLSMSLSLSLSLRRIRPRPNLDLSRFRPPLLRTHARDNEEHTLATGLTMISSDNCALFSHPRQNLSDGL